jgi:cysteine desulfurase
MSSPLIYFDNNATTKTDPAVLDAMMPYLTEEYGNPSSAYRFGKRSAEAVEKARAQVAHLLGCEPKEILFTSCGTESNNAAIASALTLDPDKQHVITTRVEHSAIIKHGEWLAKRGVEVTWLGVDEKGQIDLGELERAIRPDTAIVSTMWANNETGTIFPVEEIAALVHKKRVLFHTDAVQAVGKVPINLAHAHSHINFLSMSGHKLHCPKGIGILYVNRRTRFNPYLMGGGQEHGKRAGTENVPYCVAIGEASELAGKQMAHENSAVLALRDRFEQQVIELIPDSQVNGDRGHRLPNTTSIAFEGIDSEAVLMLLDQAGVCCSAGSACTTGSVHPSHVLKAMGFSTERARASLRFSFSRYNTAEEIERGIQILRGAIEKLRRVSMAA